MEATAGLHISQPSPFPNSFKYFIISFQFIYLYQIIQFLAGIIKMFAHYIAYIFALCFHGMHHQVFHHWNTTTATCSCFCTFLYCIYSFATFSVTALQIVPFVTAFTTADQVLHRVSHVTPAPFIASPPLCTKNHIFRIGRKHHFILTGLQQHIVCFCITN